MDTLQHAGPGRDAARLALSLVIGLTLVACDDFVMTPDRTPSSVQVTPREILLTEGDTAAFEVTVLDQDGEPYVVPGWARPLWTATEDSLVTFDAESRALAIGPGETDATVDVAGLKALTTIRINPAQMAISVPVIYVNQAVQRPEAPLRESVPLVPGRPGMLRVWLTSDVPNFFTPSVRARLYLDGEEVHSMLMEGESESVPETFRENRALESYDAIIPGDLIRPGLGLVVEIDPTGVIPHAPGSVQRVPVEGTRLLDVREVPPFRLMFVPVHQTRQGTTGDITPANALDRLQHTMNVFPLDAMDVVVREPYTTDADLTTQSGWNQLLGEITLLQQTEAQERYYYGAADLPIGSPWGGYAYIGQQAPLAERYASGIGTDTYMWTIAHELGHMLSLRHAPCGDPAGPDPNYPYPDGSIGRYGFNQTTGSLQNPTQRKDLMTYCGPEWISDYHYEKALDYREAWDWPTSGGAAQQPSPATRDALVVWGQVVDGAITLEPAFRLEARPTRFTGRGSYLVEGYDVAGARLFSLPFEPEAVSHDDDARLFTLAIPADVAAADRVARIVVRGPDASLAERRRSADAQATLVRDAATGNILALDRTGSAAARPGIELHVSDGVRTRVIRQ